MDDRLFNRKIGHVAGRKDQPSLNDRLITEQRIAEGIATETFTHRYRIQEQEELHEKQRRLWEQEDRRHVIEKLDVEEVQRTPEEPPQPLRAARPTQFDPFKAAEEEEQAAAEEYASRKAIEKRKRGSPKQQLTPGKTKPGPRNIVQKRKGRRKKDG